jgi:uridine kinase
MLIIGIAGGTGSGKTTVVHQIMNELPDTEVGIISQDSYYKENHNLSFDERALLNFDHPRAIDFALLVAHLKSLENRKQYSNPFILLSLITEQKTPLLPTPEK